MTMSNRFLSIKIIGAVISVVLSSPSFISAQALEEVVVTAQRRVQSLQDVPISIQTVSGDEMIRQGFRTLTDMSVFSPGLVIKNEEEEQGLILRGAGTQGKNFALEAGVPAFVDGLHFGRASSLKSAFLDVEQVEVLRGPQPVFFGQNASAGAINIRTKRPGKEWDGKAVAEYGNYGRQSIEVASGGPISDSFGIRVAGKYDKLEGWMTDWLTGDKFPQQEFKMVRGTIQWKPTEQFEATVKGEYTEQNFGPRSEALVRDKWNTNFNLADSASAFVTGIPSVNAPSLRNAPVGDVGKLGIRRGPLFLSSAGTGYTQANTSNTGELFDLAKCTPGMFNLNNEGVAEAPDAFLNCDFSEQSLATPWHGLLDMNYAFDNGIELQSLTGFSHQIFFSNRGSGSVYISNPRLREEDFNQWSTELRLTSPTGETIEWMTGLYYQNNELEVAVDTWRANNADAIRANRSSELSEWMSAFATVTYNFADDKTSLDIGARYTDINKFGEGQNMVAEWIVLAPAGQTLFTPGTQVRLPYGTGVAKATFLGATTAARALWANAQIVGRGPYGSFSPGAVVNPTRTADIENTFEDTSFDPQIVLRYRPSEDLSLYAKYATAYKGGGFDMSVSEVTSIAKNFVFGSEQVETYEVGARGTYFDGRASLEATLFNTNFSGLQVEFLDRSSGSAINVTQNVADQRSRGLELTGRYQATDKLMLSSSVALLDAEIRSFPASLCTETETLLGKCINGTIDRSGTEPRNAPTWQGFAKVDYDVYKNETYDINFDTTFSFSDGFITDRAWATVSKMDRGYDLNTSLSVDILEKWNVTFWGRNLLESFRETYHPENDDIGTTGIQLIQLPINGFATYGMQIGYEFF